MKTDQEILARIEEVEHDDWMGTQRGDLVVRLPWALAKPYLREDTELDEAKWEQGRKELLAPMDLIKDYLPFAWDKANNCRGLSAGRSLEHIKTWLWLEGYDKLVKDHFETYDMYGKLQLVVASSLVNFDWAAADNKRWANDEDGDGLPEGAREERIFYAQAIAHHAEKGI